MESMDKHCHVSTGDLVIGVIASATIDGEWEIYAENTTGKEPIRGLEDRDNPTHATTSQLLRFTTKDFISYSDPKTGRQGPTITMTRQLVYIL